jgi:hypothetical protein
LIAKRLSSENSNNLGSEKSYDTKLVKELVAEYSKAAARHRCA